MKARVRATGRIVTITGTDGICLTDETGNYHLIRDLEGCEAMPDYWERLKHQHVGLAMQGILANPETVGLDDIDVAATSIRIANITISKLKEEEK